MECPGCTSRNGRRLPTCPGGACVGRWHNRCRMHVRFYRVCSLQCERRERDARVVAVGRPIFRRRFLTRPKTCRIFALTGMLDPPPGHLPEEHPQQRQTEQTVWTESSPRFCTRMHRAPLPPHARRTTPCEEGSLLPAAKCAWRRWRCCLSRVPRLLNRSSLLLMPQPNSRRC